MAGSVRVVLTSVWDDKGIKEAQSSIQKVSDGVDKAFKAVGVAVAAAGVAVGAFAKSAVEAASDLQESTNAVNVAFGSAAAGVLDIGKNSAEAFGLARNEFNAAAVRFSAFAERVVGSGGDVAGFIQDVTGRAADFASVFNIDVAEALQVFQSGLAGEAEPLKRFGINLLESEVKAYALRTGLITVGETMDEQTKVQARYGLLMESTAKTAGDFANTSDGLANSQRILRATFTDLQAEIGTALLPVVTDLLRQVADYLLPKMQELGAWLQSPAGTAAIKQLADGFTQAFQAVFQFLDFLGRNWQTIVAVGAAVLGAMAAIKLYTTAVKIAAVAQGLLNATLALNPIGLAVLAIAGLTAALVINNGETEQAIKNYQALQSETDQLNYETKSLADNYRESAWAADKYGVETEAIVETQTRLKAITENVSGELGRFNNIKLNSVRNEVKMTADAMAALNQQNMDFARARSGQLTGVASGRGVQTTATTVTTGGGGGGPSRLDQQRDLIKDAQEQLSSALASYQKATASARKAYDKAIDSAEKSYAQAIVAAAANRDKSLANAAEAHAKNIASIQADFAKRQADIIQQSINRLRDAYRNAVQTNVADLFGTEAVGKSIDNLVTSLRDRLSASRRLVENSAQLASSGFSQTFIEQIVGAGVETGNELASAILEATPETQKELQGLFRALEVESTTGMDTLAQTMYEKTGLATDELKKLYEQTNADLVTALAQAQADYLETQAQILTTFDEAMKNATDARATAFATAQEQLTEALAEAATALNEQLDKIKKDFESKIAEMGGAVKSLRDEINGLFAMIASARSGASSITVPTPVAPKISPVPTVPSKTTQPTQVINLNVKTDATQSPAQTANKLLEAINSRARSGGGGLLRRV